MIVDVHAHFYTEACGRADWERLNRRRIDVGDRIGITYHVASILGSWGRTSPTYMSSREDISQANTGMVRLTHAMPHRVRAYCVVNPNFPDHAEAEVERGFAAGMIGIKLAASRRANDELLDAVVLAAARHQAPILHHIWQRRRRDWPGQEASDAVELVGLARRHPSTPLILAHIGGGGDWAHSLRAVRPVPNVFVDLSGSGVDSGMLESAIDAVGVERMLWGTDVTLDTGLAKLRSLGTILSDAELERVSGGNARAIFPPGAFE